MYWHSEAKKQEDKRIQKETKKAEKCITRYLRKRTENFRLEDEEKEEIKDVLSGLTDEEYKRALAFARLTAQNIIKAMDDKKLAEKNTKLEKIAARKKAKYDKWAAKNPDVARSNVFWERNQMRMS